MKIRVPDLHDVKDRTPILIDDIVSSGRTMIETARQLRREGLSPAVCIAVHALFSQETESALREVSGRLVTTNSVPHATNEIDLTVSIAERYLLRTISARVRALGWHVGRSPRSAASTVMPLPVVAAIMIIRAI